ncbi:MAG: F0F1 ATP synthase subunit delta [Candidatus Roizmanbacteria bacterium]
MLDEKKLLLLTEKLKTQEDLHIIFQQLDEYMESMYKSKFIDLSILSNYFSYSVKQSLIAIMQLHNINENDKSQIIQFFHDLKIVLNQLPTIHIYIGINPSEHTINAIKSWMVSQLQREVILDIQVDPKIFGGAIIEYNGYHRDYTINGQIINLIIDKVKKFSNSN